MKVVMLGDITTLEPKMVAGKVYVDTEVRWRLQGCVIDLTNSPDRWGFYTPMLNLSLGEDVLPYPKREMFVLYNEWFSLVPTTLELECFEMNFGWCPLLKEIRGL